METKQSNNSATPMADAVKIANQRALFSLEWENDTVFKKRELNYKTKAAFQKDLEAGKISKYTTVFIKDSKEIYKNGQYYGASSSSVVDITNEYSSLTSGYSSEIYNKLLGYANSGVITYINDTDRGEAHFVSLSNMYEKLVMSSIATDYNGAPILECYVVDSSIGVVYDETMYFASKDMIGSATLGTYNKAQSYKPISSGDNLSSAIGKLEASVSSEDFILDLSKYTYEFGAKFNLNPEDLEGVKTALNNKKDILLYSNTEFVTQGALVPILKYQLEGAVLLQYKCMVEYFINEHTYTVIINTNTNECSILLVANFIAPSEKDILLNVASNGFKNSENGNDFNCNILLKKSGTGTKFLSDNGEYKEISSSPSSNKGVLSFDFSSLSEESGTVSDEILNSIKEVGLKDSESASIQFIRQGITYVGELRYNAGDYSVLGTSISESIMDYIIGYITITISSDLKTYILSSSSQEIQNSGLGDKFLADDGTYKEIQNKENVVNISDLLEKISSVDDGGKIEQNDYNTLVGYLEKGKILVATNESASSNISYSYTKDNFINLSYQLQYGEIILVNSFFINNDLTIKKYVQLIPSGNGDGTRALTDNGTYETFTSEAPIDGNIYGRKDKKWEKIESKIYNYNDFIKDIGEQLEYNKLNKYIGCIIIGFSLVGVLDYASGYMIIDKLEDENIRLTSYGGGTNGYEIKSCIIINKENKQANISSHILYEPDDVDENKLTLAIAKQLNDSSNILDYGNYDLSRTYDIHSHKVVTESEYKKLGSVVNTDGILYFVTPDA